MAFIVICTWDICSDRVLLLICWRVPFLLLTAINCTYFSLFWLLSILVRYSSNVNFCVESTIIKLHSNQLFLEPFAPLHVLMVISFDFIFKKRETKEKRKKSIQKRLVSYNFRGICARAWLRNKIVFPNK